MSSAALDRTSKGVVIQDLRFSYRRGFCIHVDSLEVKRGEQVLLAGESGSGKSTLLHLIAGLEEPQSGRISIDGVDIVKLRGGARDSFRGQRIGMIFQTFNLLQGFTSLENVMLALMLAGASPSQQRTRAETALGRLGISDFHAPVETLSVGQQQRVAVARAIAGEPCVVLADEPTASLDPTNAANAIKLIQDATRSTNATLIVTSHDPLLKSSFERVINVSQFTEAVVTA